MRVKIPTPLHGWRQFIGEVGVIVLGVLIALTAQQIAQSINDRNELHEAENAMRVELRDDNLPQAFVRAAIYQCYAAQLDAIEEAVASGDRARFERLAKAYNPILRTWDDQAWQTALASQVLVPAGSKRVTDWSLAYIGIPILRQTSNQESDTLPSLWARLDGQGAISPDQRQRLFQVIAQLRMSNQEMAVGSLLFMTKQKRRGLSLPPQRRNELLKETRETYGTCVREPETEHVDLNSQISFATNVPVRKPAETR